MADNTNPKITPARRRNGRAGGRAGGGAQKAYASENDAATFDVSRQHQQHAHAPSTPSKAPSGSPVPVESSAAHPGSRQRNRNKQKGKNPHTPPESAQRRRRTSPQSSMSTKTSSSAAFAGATFHASPAPSALPIPSFLSKVSNRSPVHTDAAEVAQQPSPPATDNDAPTPFRPSSVPQSHESPLDFMFRAHREEKQRLHQGAPLDPASDYPHNTSPPRPRVRDPNASIASSAPPASRLGFAKHSFGGIHSSELDGTPGRPMGPAFSTPYQERIKAARSSSSRPQSQPGRQDTAGPQQPSDDPTEALKKFLFGGNKPQESTHTAAPSSATGTQASPRDWEPAPALSAPSGNPDTSRTGDFQALENDLRRILKLDMAPDASSPDSRLLSR